MGSGVVEISLRVALNSKGRMSWHHSFLMSFCNNTWYFFTNVSILLVNMFILFLLGDTLYYRFTSDLDTNDWGYKFTVTGGHRGRFLTGELVQKMVWVGILIKLLPHLLL